MDFDDFEMVSEEAVPVPALTEKEIQAAGDDVNATVS